MATARERTASGVEIVGAEEAYAICDDQARHLMGLSGAEFLRRWEAGEYADIVDTPGHLHITHLAVLMPLAKQLR